MYSTGESFSYAYDPVGNRVGLTTVTPLSGTLVTTHTFDIANRLEERVVSDGRVYTYTWSAKGELLEEVTQGVPVRTFTYNGAGYLVEASVFTLTTVFTYNGLGIRVAMAVADQPETRYVVDYLDGNRILEESSGTSVTHYVYGASDQVCLGEVNEDDEWTHYLPDGERQVRQTADDEGELAETWLYDPEGTVLEGPQGPLTHLVCNGVYDWSTGLIHTDGGYFDPRLGIWLMMAPLGVIGLWRGRRRKRPWEVLLVLMVWTGTLLSGCDTTNPNPCNLPDDTPKIRDFSATVNGQVDVFGPTRAPEFSFGNFTRGVFGIGFMANVDVPANTVGKLMFVQHLIPQRKKYDQNGTEYDIATPNWRVDDLDPYPQRDLTPFIPITNSASHPIPLETTDTPGIQLRFHPDAVRVKVDNEKYEMYVVWESVPGNRIPLGMIEWSWSGEAKKDPNTGRWSKISGGPSEPAKWVCVRTIRQGSTPPQKDC